MMRQEESYLGYLKTRQEMLEEIEREWERPKVFDRQIEEVEKVQEGPSKIEEKLKIIQVPAFNSSSLHCLRFDRVAKAGQSLRSDRTGPRQKGVNIIPLLVEGEEPHVTITLNSMPLGQMIQFLTETVNWTYALERMPSLFRNRGSFRGRPLETNFMKSPKEPLTE